MYSTFVWIASKVLRNILSGNSMNIIYTELPYVDRVYQMCIDIYMVMFLIIMTTLNFTFTIVNFLT